MGRRLGSGKRATELREIRENTKALSDVVATMLSEKDAEIAHLRAEVERYRAALTIIAGSSDRLQAAQAVCALDNIGATIA